MGRKSLPPSRLQKWPRRLQEQEKAQKTERLQKRAGSYRVHDHPPRRGAAHPGLIPKAAIRKGQATPTSYSPRNGMAGLSARPDLAGSAALGAHRAPLACRGGGGRGQGGGSAPRAHRLGRRAPNKAAPARIRRWETPGRVPAAALSRVGAAIAEASPSVQAW